MLTCVIVHVDNILKIVTARVESILKSVTFNVLKDVTVYVESILKYVTDHM